MLLKIEFTYISSDGTVYEKVAGVAVPDSMPIAKAHDSAKSLIERYFLEPDPYGVVCFKSTHFELYPGGYAGSLSHPVIKTLS